MPRAGSQQQFQCWRQREFILKFMRHWLAGVLARERPALFRDLPESFKVGHPLPQMLQPVGPLTAERPRNLKSRRARSDAPYLHFVHGCELLPV